MRHRKDGKHAKGLNLSCDNCGMVLKSNYHYDVHRRICDQNIGENFVILERVNVNSKLHNILKKLNPSEFYNAVNEDSISMEGFWPPLFRFTGTFLIKSMLIFCRGATFAKILATCS